MERFKITAQADGSYAMAPPLPVIDKNKEFEIEADLKPGVTKIDLYDFWRLKRTGRSNSKEWQLKAKWSGNNDVVTFTAGGATKEKVTLKGGGGSFLKTHRIKFDLRVSRSNANTEYDPILEEMP